MRTVGTTTGHDSFRHEATFYRGNSDFVTTTAPFVRDAVRSGQPVMVAVVPERLELLSEALGDDAGAVRLVDMSRLGRNPANIIPAWRAFVDEHGRHGRPVRGVGEPVWDGRSAAEIAECQLHEALLNTALAPDTAFWLRCPYDITALDEGVIAASRRSHPALVEGASYSGSRDYSGADLVDALFEADFDEPHPSASILRFGRGDYAAVRQATRWAATAAGLTEGRATDLALGVHEIATNSVKHGGGQGSLRMWTADDALVIEVRDDGVIADRLVGRTTPPTSAVGGRGVWLANRLCDLVQIRSGPRGTAVRLISWLGR